MTRRPGMLFLASFVALLALIVLALGPGRPLQPQQGAGVGQESAGGVASAASEPYLQLSDQELLQLASLTEAPIDQPVDWGPYRVVASNHPEWAAYMASVTRSLSPEQKAWSEEWRRNSLTNWSDTQARIPGGLREPRWLPPGVSKYEIISGNVGPDSSYSIRYSYGKPREGGEKPGEPGTAIKTGVVVSQASGAPPLAKPIYVENRNTRITTTQ